MCLSSKVKISSPSRDGEKMAARLIEHMGSSKRRSRTVQYQGRCRGPKNWEISAMDGVSPTTRTGTFTPVMTKTKVSFQVNQTFVTYLQKPKEKSIMACPSEMEYLFSFDAITLIVPRFLGIFQLYPWSIRKSMNWNLVHAIRVSDRVRVYSDGAVNGDNSCPCSRNGKTESYWVPKVQ